MPINSVRVRASGTGANLGLFYDHAGAAYSSPVLDLELSLAAEAGVSLTDFSSQQPTPAGRVRGTAGKLALEALLSTIDNAPIGVRLTYSEPEEDGFPTGGTGSSGAEAAAAVVAANALLELGMSPTDLILAAAKGEPGGHLDNVAPAVLGGIVFIDQNPDGSASFEKVTAPPELGLLLGISSHQKVGGTEAARNALKDPLPEDVQAAQDERALRAKQALSAGDVQLFLELVNTDEFHEPRRADAGVYGNFSAADLRNLRSNLAEQFGVALSISGAGPSMQFWYAASDRERVVVNEVVHPELQQFIDSWFGDHQMQMKLRPITIANTGAHVLK